jgi:aspartate aminotransferase
MVSSGSKMALFNLLSILGKKRVILPKPCWPAYELICKQLGLEVVAVQTTMSEKWMFKLPKLEARDVIILCTPLNPTSTFYPKELVDKTIEEAERVGAVVIIDEAYRGLAYEEVSPPKYNYQNAVRLRSFSKEFNMEGWRLGYAVAPKEIVAKMVKFTQISTTCVPPFTQLAGLACLENEKAIIKENMTVWEKRNKMSQRLLRDAGFEFTTPDAGIYVYLTHPKMKDQQGSAFVEKCLENGVVIAPGDEFGNSDFVRFCINQPEEVLIEAVKKMKNVT